jgi:septal ring factor EnvC (AmiA/AmiB activator)
MDPVSLIKTRLAEREAEVKNLSDQIQRSEQFLSAVRAQHLHSAGKLAELHDLLQVMETIGAPMNIADILSLAARGDVSPAATAAIEGLHRVLPTAEDLDRHVADNPA